MALITCPECGKQVSSIAVSCPGCGYPIAAFQTDQATVEKPKTLRERPPVLSQREYRSVFSPDKFQPIEGLVVDTTNRLFKVKELLAPIHSIDNILFVDTKDSIDEDTDITPEFSVGVGKAYTGGLFSKKKKTRGIGTAVTFKKEKKRVLDGVYLIITVVGAKGNKELEIYYSANSCELNSSEYRVMQQKIERIKSSIEELRYS